MIVVKETLPGVFEEIPVGMSFMDRADVLHGWQVTQVWTDEELRDIGVYRVAAAEIPAGKSAVGIAYERDGDEVIQVLTFDDVPITVPASSAKLVLDDDGIYEAVETICLAHPVLAVRIYWSTAATWESDNPYVQAIGMEMDLTDEQMIDMFQRALLK